MGFLDRLSGRTQGDIEARIQALKHPDGDRRTAAADALAEKGAAAVDPLLAALDDCHPGVRAGAAYALGKIGERRAVEPLIALLDDANDHVRGVVVPALGRLGDHRAAGPLARALDDRHQPVRLQAARVLGELGEPEAVPALVAALDDTDREVRLQAAGALAKLGDTRAVEPLMDRLTGREDYARVQVVAVIGLGDLRDPRAIPPLVRILEIGDATFRAAAAEALGKIGLPRFAALDAVQPLVDALGDDDPFVRRLAAQSLGQLSDRRAVAPLRRTLQDADQDVRAAAETAMQALEERGIDVEGPPGPADAGIALIGRRQKGRYTYIEYRGPAAAAARAFLKRQQREVRKPNHYVTVETPEGIWGIDKEGLYLIRLLPWQSDLSRAQCSGAVVEPPTSFSLQQAILQDAIDNYIATVRCGRCEHRWRDGLNHLAPTVVRCPNCGSYNRIESAVRPE